MGTPWSRFVGMVSRHRGKFSLGTIVGLVLGLLAWMYPDFWREEPPYKIGDWVPLGPVSVQVSDIECDKTVHDFSEALRSSIEESLPEGDTLEDVAEGELCFADFDVRNDSKESLPFYNLQPVLAAQDEKYLAIAADTDPTDPPIIFPGGSQAATFAFDVAAGVVPTGLELTYPVDEDDEELASLVL